MTTCKNCNQNEASYFVKPLFMPDPGTDLCVECIEELFSEQSEDDSEAAEQKESDLADPSYWNDLMGYSDDWQPED